MMNPVSSAFAAMYFVVYTGRSTNINVLRAVGSMLPAGAYHFFLNRFLSLLLDGIHLRVGETVPGSVVRLLRGEFNAAYLAAAVAASDLVRAGFGFSAPDIDRIRAVVNSVYRDIAGGYV